MLLSERVSQTIKNRILNDPIKPGQRLPPVASLVKELNVNPRTVLSAFELLKNDGIIHCEPRKRAVVLPSAEEKTHSIAFVRWCSDSFCMKVMEGVQRYFQDHGQDVSIIDACSSHDNFLNFLNNPPEGTDGLILLPFATDEYKQAISNAQAKGLKIVFVDRILQGFSASSVVSDNFVGAYQAVTHLIEAHHQPVYYIGNTLSPSSVCDRVRGWQTAMVEHNYLDFKSYLVELLSDEETISENFGMNWTFANEVAIKLFNQARQDRYCIFTGNDADANGVHMAAKECGLKVAKDVFIIGFDDAPFCTKLKPTLSSVRQDVCQLGFEAAKLLHQELLGSLKSPICKVLPVELIIRESSQVLDSK